MPDIISANPFVVEYADFIHDEEKMHDFYLLTREEFLASYSYLAPEDYELTRFNVEALKEDRITYIADGYVHWIYHNPDAISGDQFVENIFSADLLNEALKRSASIYDVWEFLCERGSVFLYDYNPAEYTYSEYWWTEKEFFATPFAVGCTRGTLHKIIAWLDNAGYNMAAAYQMVYTLPERSE